VGGDDQPGAPTWTAFAALLLGLALLTRRR
jgi:MYXO-CTERM domain-containing protein